MNRMPGLLLLLVSLGVLIPAGAQQAPLYTNGSLTSGASGASAAAPAGASASSSVDLADIDRKANPCTDFYQYACGNWQATHAIPADQSRWGTFSDLAERNREELHSLLENAEPASAKRDPIEAKVGDYYAACMDEARVNQLAATPVQPELQRIAAIRSQAELAAEVARLQVIGVEVMFNFGSDQDLKDSTRMIAELDQGGLGLPDRDYYIRTDANSVKLRQQYQQHVARMLALAGDAQLQAEAEAARILALETALARGSQTRVSRRTPENTYHMMSRAQMVALAPGFDWNGYFTGVGAPAFTSINVTSPDFFKALNAELKAAPLADWKAYLRWRLVHSVAPALSAPFVAENFNFFGKTLNGTPQNSARWKRCVTATDRDLGEALGQLYVKATFGPDAKAKMLVMVNQLQQSLGNDIREVSWLDPATKQQALAKLAAFTRQIGYPDKWRDYSSLAIKRDDYYGNTRRAQAFEWRRDLNKIGRPVDRSEWGMTPPTVNAYYRPDWNEIVFPAGILQPPFYDAKRDPAVNFGAIGVVMGHEMTHGFDDSGAQFDGRGNLRDWWTKSDEAEFKKKADCIADEYSRFSPLPGVELNGHLTEGENIADNGGARIAYSAMLAALDGQLDQKIDGYTAPQRFFLGYAQVWCENVRPAAARNLATIDPHSPGRFRTNGVVSNMPEFAKAFSCGPNDAMTAGPHACRVW